MLGPPLSASGCRGHVFMGQQSPPGLSTWGLPMDSNPISKSDAISSLHKRREIYLFKTIWSAMYCLAKHVSELQVLELTREVRLELGDRDWRSLNYSAKQKMFPHCWEPRRGRGLNMNYSERVIFCGASGKEPACQCRKHNSCGFDPWAGKMRWRTKWQPLQCSCLENPMDRGAWWATVHGVTKSRA